VSPEETPQSPLVTRHLRVGLWALLVFVVLGVVLEGLHAVKAPSYLDAGRETSRLLLRLAHAHGTLLSILHLVYGLLVRARPALGGAFASAGLLAALVLLPAGFLLGGLFARGGDPGLGILLVPPGAIALAGALASAARRA